MNSRVALAFTLLVGCTFGGSDEDPTAGYTSMNVDPAMDGGVIIDDGDEDPTPRLDASVRSDGGTKSDSGAVDASIKKPDSGSGNSCTPKPAVPVCDPVKNMGCGLFTQCDLDTEAMAQSGRCVFWSLGFLGCSSDDVSTTCGSTNACVDGTCRKMCYCDADCGSGTKCSGAAPGPAGPVRICQ